MKKFRWLLLFFPVLLAGCFETTEEIAINKDGSGLFSNSVDLSQMVGLLKQIPGADTMKVANADTAISLSGIADSIKGITPQQKKMIAEGSMRLTLNLDDEKLVIKFNLPFQRTSDVQQLQALLPKITGAAMKKLPGTGQLPAESDSSQIKTFDDFYDSRFTGNVISKTLDKEKYAAAKDGQYMQSLKQISEMGSPIAANYIIDLPRPAKKVEGKALKLSEDKKKVTIAVTSDDFFNDPSKFEFRIEY